MPPGITPLKNSFLGGYWFYFYWYFSVRKIIYVIVIWYCPDKMSHQLAILLLLVEC